MNRLFTIATVTALGLFIGSAASAQAGEKSGNHSSSNKHQNSGHHDNDKYHGDKDRCDKDHCDKDHCDKDHCGKDHCGKDSCGSDRCGSTCNDPSPPWNTIHPIPYKPVGPPKNTIHPIPYKPQPIPGNPSRLAGLYGAGATKVLGNVAGKGGSPGRGGLGGRPAPNGTIPTLGGGVDSLGNALGHDVSGALSGIVGSGFGHLAGFGVSTAVNTVGNAVNDVGNALVDIGSGIASFF